MNISELLHSNDTTALSILAATDNLLKVQEKSSQNVMVIKRYKKGDFGIDIRSCTEIRLNTEQFKFVSDWINAERK